MNIIYKKDTLYVYLKEKIDNDVIETLNDRVSYIMGTFNIDNLIINTEKKSYKHCHELENEIKTRRSKVEIE